MDEGFAELGDPSAGGLGQSTKKVLFHEDFAENPLQAAEKVSRSCGGTSQSLLSGVTMGESICVCQHLKVL